MPFDAWARRSPTKSECGKLWSGQNAMSGRVNEASCWITCKIRDYQRIRGATQRGHNDVANSRATHIQCIEVM